MRKIIGIGVDLLHRPRVAGLIQRRINHHQNTTSNSDQIKEDEMRQIQRFSRRILSPVEITGLGINSGQSKELQEKLCTW